MAGLLRRILDSGYTIVAIGTVGFLLVFTLQFVVETTRREAFLTLNNAQDAQSMLSLLSKEVWELRYWDNSPDTNHDLIMREREGIQKRVKVHQEALRQYTQNLDYSSEYEALSKEIDAYVTLSNDSNVLWQRLGRWSDNISQNSLTAAITTTEKAAAMVSPPSPLYRSLRVLQLAQYEMFAVGVTRVRPLPDPDQLATLATKVLKDIPSSTLPAEMRAELKGAMEGLVNRDYLAQQAELGNALNNRNTSFANLEASLREMSLKVVERQKQAGEGFRIARKQSLYIVSLGCLLLGILFVAFGTATTRATRKQSKLLQLSERRFKDFASASSDTLIEIDANYNIITTFRTSDAVQYDAPYSSAGQPFLAQRTDAEPSKLQILLDKREAFRGYEARLPTDTSAEHWRRINGVPFYDDNQNFAGYRLSVLNLAEQKALEHEIKLKQDIYEQLAEQVPGAVFVVRLDGSNVSSLEYVSPSFKQFTGFSQEEANQRYTQGNSLLFNEAAFNQARQMRDASPIGAIEMKTKLRRRDGTLVPIIYSSRAIKPAENGQLRRLVMMIDLTDLEAAEQALLDRERQLTSILSNIGSAYFFSVTMGNGKIMPQFCSPGVEKVLGYSVQEWMDLFDDSASFALTAHPDDRARIKAEFDAMASGKDPTKWEFQSVNRRCRKDGTVIRCMTRGRHIRLPDGRLLQEGMVIDVSADMQRQEELIRLKAAVDGASDAIAVWSTENHATGEPRTLIYANKAATQFIDRVGRNGERSGSWMSIRDAAATPTTTSEVDKALDKDGRWSGRSDIVCADGTVLVMDITVTRIADNTDLHVLRNVTAEMQRQEELMRLKAAVDAATESIAIWKMHDATFGGPRDLIYANKVAQSLLALTAPPNTEDKWSSVRRAAEPNLLLTEIDRAVAEHGRWQGLGPIQCNDGTTIIADITVARIDDLTALHVVRDVTALKALEADREKARAELQDVVTSLDFAGENIVITHPLKDIVFANKSFASWCGNGDPKEVVGKRMVDLLIESDPPLDQIAKEMSAVAERGEVYTTEATVTLRKDGSKRVMRWSTVPLKDGRWINISRDVTEVRALERKRMRLDRSVADIASRRELSRMPPREVYETILREIARSLEVPRVSIWRVTTDKSALQSVLALHDGKLSTKFVTFERDTREAYFDELFKLRSVVTNDTSEHFAADSLYEDYYQRLGITSALDVPILWQGSLWGVICIEHVGPARAWDVSEVTYATYMADFIVMTLERLGRDEAQARIEFLYQENASILSALDSTQERIIIEDAGGYVRYVNQAVADAWGSGSKTDLMGRPFLSAFPLLQPYRKSMETEVLAAISQSGTWNGQLMLTRPSGEPAYVDIQVMQLPDKGLLYTAEDVTERRKHEQREQQLKTQLIEAQKMESIGRLAGGVAHDFNNIVAAVRAFASLVSSEVQSGTKAKTYSERIINTCDRAADLVRQILLFSRASRADLKPTSMGEVIEEVTAYLRASIPASITVDIARPENDPIVLGNAAQLVQIVMNLGLNARDAIGEKPGRIQIYSEERILSDQELNAYKPGLTIANTKRNDGVIVHQYVVGAPLTEQRYLCLTVRDDGPGMSGITVERMFEPFFTTKEKARGTGLGLPVVAAVVAAHSGFIVVTTQQSRGCRFHVYLPMSRHAVELADAPMRPDIERLRGTERILLVDDEADLADATTLLLRKYGYDVAPLYFPRDALRIFEEDPMAWDVVITDQVMPAMKGLELISHIRKVRDDIPVILCTGFSDFATERNAKALGADAFFTKPVLPENLAQAIRQLLDEKIVA
jgi:PAS domain S-box-containing protein